MSHQRCGVSGSVHGLYLVDVAASPEAIVLQHQAVIATRQTYEWRMVPYSQCCEDTAKMTDEP